MRALTLSSLGFALLLEAMLAAAVLFWPEFSQNLANLRGMFAQVPMIQDMMGSVEEYGLPGYVLAQHFFKGCNALGTAAAILFAAPAVAGEAHRGTLELLLARPQSRTRILLERWLSGALALLLPVFLTTLTIPWLCARVDEYEPYGPYLLCALHQGLFLLAIYSLTFLGSALGSNPIRISLGLFFACVFQFAIYMVKTVTHASLFRLCDLEILLSIYGRAHFPAGTVTSLAATVVLSTGLAWLAFRRRTP